MTKTFLLAGGTSGVGRATVELLADAGHRLLCACRNPEQLPARPNVEPAPFEATDPNSSPELPESLDGMVYFPGSIRLKPFHLLRDDDILEELQINFLGAARLLRQALPALKNSGQASVVFFSTVAVSQGFPFHAGIAAAKGALEGFARSLAAEFAPSIRLNCIAPSLTDTPLAKSFLTSEAKREACAERHPLQRVGEPRETAKLVHFLLSADSAFMTGQVLGLDGGLSTLRTQR